MSELEQSEDSRDGGVEPAEPSKLPAVAEELERLERDAADAARRPRVAPPLQQCLLADRAPGGDLAAAAGTSALAGWSTALTAAIAFAAAALAAFQSLTRPDEREESHRRRGAAYDVLAGRARILRLVELETLSLQQATERLVELNDQLGALESQATFIK